MEAIAVGPRTARAGKNEKGKRTERPPRGKGHAPHQGTDARDHGSGRQDAPLTGREVTAQRWNWITLADIRTVHGEQIARYGGRCEGGNGSCWWRTSPRRTVRPANCRRS